MKIERTEILPGIISLRFENQYDTCSTFMRLQEFYESPFREIKGKFFTLEKYMDRYAKAKGNFTYTSDWGGFNVPGHVVVSFFDVFKDDLLDKEKILCLHLWPKFSQKFYVIAHFGEKMKVDWSKKESLHTTLAHEVAHGLFYLDDNYQKAALELVNGLSEDVKAKIKEKLLGTGGYCKSVLKDETQAYLSTSSEDYLKSHFGCSFKQYTKKFQKLLMDTLAVHK